MTFCPVSCRANRGHGHLLCILWGWKTFQFCFSNFCGLLWIYEFYLNFLHQFTFTYVRDQHQVPTSIFFLEYIYVPGSLGIDFIDKIVYFLSWIINQNHWLIMEEAFNSLWYLQFLTKVYRPIVLSLIWLIPLIES